MDALPVPPTLEATPVAAPVDPLHLPQPWQAYVPSARPDSMAAEVGVRLMPRPGTAVRYRGRQLYFATELQTVLEIQPMAYWVLAAFLVGGTYEQAAEILRREGIQARRSEVLDLLLQYRELGLFRAPPAFRATGDFERTIDGLVAHQPMKMMLFMAQSCNLRCTYCYGIEGNYNDRGEKMSAELARTAVDHLMDSGPARPHFYIYFFGGEPLVNVPVIRETVAYARSTAKAQGKTVEFGLTTNGVLVTDEIADYLIAEDFQLCVSIDGTPAGHNVNRPTKGGGGSHAQALRGLERLRRRSTRRSQVKVRATMSHQNHDPLEIASYFESIGITNYGIGTTFERAGSPHPTDVSEEDLRSIDASFERVLDQVVSRLDRGQRLPRYNPFFKTVGSMTQGSRRAFIGCGVCRNDQGIGTDGDIYPCHRYVGLKNYVIGNVRSGVDKDRLRTVYRQFFDMWERHCQNCWARYTCSGACMWQHSHDDGRLRNPMSYECESIRRSVHRSAWLTLHLSQEHPQVFESLCRTHAQSGKACCNPQ